MGFPDWRRIWRSFTGQKTENEENTALSQKDLFKSVRRAVGNPHWLTSLKSRFKSAFDLTLADVGASGFQKMFYVFVKYYKSSEKKNCLSQFRVDLILGKLPLRAIQGSKHLDTFFRDVYVLMDSGEALDDWKHRREKSEL